MRLPFPERIPLKPVVVFASLLYVVEQLQGTDAFFSICVFLFILVATLTFNMAGGFTRPSGGYVFFYATLGSIVGWTWKAVVGEAADSNLRRPNLTASVFLCGIVAMSVAVFVSRKLSRRRGIVEDMLKERDIPTAILGSAAMGIVLTMLANTTAHEDGSLLSALSQINEWIPIAIVMGVTYEIRRSDGRRSLNPVILTAAAVSIVVGGLVGFSKEGLFTAPVCYLLAACSMRYKVGMGQIAAWVVAIGLMCYYMVPYSQYGRNLRDQEAESVARFARNAALAGDLLGDLSAVREKYEADEREQMESFSASYFNEDQGILNRLQMVLPDDQLIDAAERGRSPFGLLPVYSVLAYSVPHFLWPEKPTVAWGNIYAHQIGGLIDDRDFTTGISFSPSGEAYYAAGFAGVFLVAPLVWTALFVFYDSVFGDTRRSPWGLVAIAIFSHLAPETMLSGAILGITRYGIGLLFAAAVCAYAMPVIGSIFVRRPAQSGPRQAPAIAEG